MTRPDHLFSPEVTAHCFFAGRCSHSVTGTPEWVHAEMEGHYELDHRADLRAVRERYRR